MMKNKNEAETSAYHLFTFFCYFEFIRRVLFEVFKKWAVSFLTISGKTAGHIIEVFENRVVSFLTINGKMEGHIIEDFETWGLARGPACFRVEMTLSAIV